MKASPWPGPGRGDSALTPLPTMTNGPDQGPGLFEMGLYPKEETEDSPLVGSLVPSVLEASVRSCEPPILSQVSSPLMMGPAATALTLLLSFQHHGWGNGCNGISLSFKTQVSLSKCFQKFSGKITYFCSVTSTRRLISDLTFTL